MPLLLTNRNTSVIEWMDKPDCDRNMLFATYRHFSLINRVLSRWRRIYQTHIKPDLNRGQMYTLLDIGFGGADIIRYIDRWAKTDGFNFLITGIETDSRALEYVHQQSWPANFHFENISLSEIVSYNKTFDYVISNHLIHHLTKEEIARLLADSIKICKNRVLFNDIERSDIAYFLFKILTKPFFRNSFISDDGQLSIKRSFTFQEMQNLIPTGWQVSHLRPYRLLLEYKNMDK
jgi:2-polyprenyl-3-methyl-5-hydroxy-6-metoxy-1,4-benzoquinol methylase